MLLSPALSYRGAHYTVSKDVFSRAYALVVPGYLPEYGASNVPGCLREYDANKGTRVPT